MAGKGEKVKMLIFHRGKTDRADRTDCTDDWADSSSNSCNSEKGFVLLRGLIAMFIVLICFSGILFSLSVVSRGSFLLREEVYKEIEQRNESVLRSLN